MRRKSISRRKLNTIFLFAIAGLYSFISVGYAALSQNLMISGDVAYSYDNLLYDVLKKEAKSGGQAREYTGSHQDSILGTGNKEIYYWYAANDTEGTQVQNKDNVAFAGHCWKMIRTTDTGGVKLLYNGEIENGQCLNTRGNHIGYSNSDVYNVTTPVMYGTDYVYDSSGDSFSLTGSLEQTVLNSYTGPSLIGKYTCLLEENDSCSTLYYVKSYNIETGNTSLIKIEKNSHYSQFGAGQFNTYSIDSAIELVGYRNNKHYIVGMMDGPTSDNPEKFASSVTYSNGTYTLSGDVVTLTDTDSSINTHHYSCGNLTGTCSSVYYVYGYGEYNSPDIITLENGEKIEDAMINMLSAQDINQNDSNIKVLIDSWFEHYMEPYSDYLEDTIFCNNRSIVDLGAWNPNGGVLSTDLKLKEYTPTTDLSCANITDRFSMSNANAQLTYKVGLITSEELNLLNNEIPRTTGTKYWTLSAGGYHDINSIVKSVNASGVIGNSTPNTSMGIRPAVSLKPDTTYNSGDGSMQNPYQVSSGKPQAPTFTESAVQNGTKTVTIHYPEGCGINYTCKYQRDNESFVEVTTQTVDVPFTSTGQLTAVVIDGMIQVTNRYNVRFNALYVSSSGNNTSGNGSIANPYKTLEKAYQMADNTATVYVMNNLTLSDTFNMGTNKNITITSCTKESDTSCPTSTANKITRGSSLTNEMIDVENGSLSLNTITMDGNNVSATRPLIYTKKNVSLNTGSTLQNGKNSGDGGGIYGASGTITFNGGTVTNNSADRGAGVFTSDGNVLMNSGTISNNTSTVSGGGVWTSGTFTMEDGTISANSAVGGAGIHVSYISELNTKGTLTVNGGSIINNTASGNGGGVCSNASGSLISSIEVTGGTISNNSAKNGGGLYVESTCYNLISNGVISSNEASENGGGIYAKEDSSFEMIGGTISNNTTDSTGGGLFCGGSCTQSGGAITGNTATTGHGGGIRVEGTYTSSGGTIQNNNAPTNLVTSNISVKIQTGTSFYDIRSDHLHDHRVFYIASGLNNTYVMDLTNGAVHGNVQLYQNSSNATHKWKLLPAKVVDGIVYYAIESQKVLTQHMSVANSSGDSGSNILTWEMADVTGRYFSLEPAGSGYYYIKNIRDICMDIEGGAVGNGKNIQANTCDNSTRQKWKLIDSSGVSKYTIQFNGNNNTGGSTASVICTVGQSCTLTANGFTRTNYKFLGWATSASGAVVYTDKQAVTNLTTTAGETVNLYAVWRDSRALYVSSSGNDTTGYGTIAKPYKTVAKAYTEAATTATISMMSNITQTETIAMGSAKTITLTSCTKASDNTSCTYSSNYSLIRGSSFTEGYIINSSNASGTLNLQNITINGNNVAANSALVRNAGTLNIKSGATLTKSNSSGNGGAIANIKTVNMSGGTLSNNKASAGGGIYATSTGTTKLSAGTITANTTTNTTSAGAGIHSSGGTLEITGGTISNNTSSATGGGIVAAGVVKISGGTITGNTATLAGGGIHITLSGSNDTTATISGGTFSNNTSSTGGGGISVRSTSTNQTTLTLSNAIITGNTAANGGGMYIYEHSTVTMNSGYFRQNKSDDQSGGAIYTYGKFTMKGGTIGGSATYANTSSTFGGGIMCQGSCSVSGGTISYNKAETGGGIHIGGNATSFALSGGTIAYNEATTHYGGGLSGRVMKVTGGTINNNKSKQFGAGVYCAETCNVQNATIKNNTATTNGGGFYCGGGTCTLTGVTITGNKADLGGGAYIESNCKLVFKGDSITNNSATTSGGGIYKTSLGTYTKSGSPTCTGNGQAGLSNACAWTAN